MIRWQEKRNVSVNCSWVPPSVMSLAVIPYSFQGIYPRCTLCRLNLKDGKAALGHTCPTPLKEEERKEEKKGGKEENKERTEEKKKGSMKEKQGPAGQRCVHGHMKHMYEAHV